MSFLTDPVSACRSRTRSTPIPAPPAVTDLTTHCRQCGQCRRHCRFLERHGSPGELAFHYQEDPAGLRRLAFHCNLCRHCQSCCPHQLDPAAMFAALRGQTVSLRESQSRSHLPLIVYERLGGSWLFSYLFLPEGATSLFYPGCGLTALRPAAVLDLYAQLQRSTPGIGILLDCCNKISLDLGHGNYAITRQQRRMAMLKEKGITRLITSCPSCYQALRGLDDDITVTTLYDLVAEHPEMAPPFPHGGEYTIHDPCATRFAPAIHRAVRTICGQRAITIKEMPHSRERTYCCGEGGGVGKIDEESRRQWRQKRLDEAGDTPLITYCAGCTSRFDSHIPTLHLIDLLFPNTPLPAPRHPPGRLTPWFNRLRVKIRLILRKAHEVRSR